MDDLTITLENRPGRWPKWVRCWMEYHLVARS